MTDQGTDGADLSARSDWKRVTGTWHDAEKIAKRKRWDYPFDNAGKTALLDRIALARVDVEALVDAGVLGETEGELLRSGLRALDERVRRFRTKDEQFATCYRPFEFYSSKTAFKRLQPQVSLLETLAASGTLRPEVIGRALAGVERDLKDASDKHWLVSLAPSERAGIRAVRESVFASLKRIHERM